MQGVRAAIAALRARGGADALAGAVLVVFGLLAFVVAAVVALL